MENQKKIFDSVFSKKELIEQMKADKPFLSLSDLAGRLRVCYKTVWRWVNQYFIIPAVKVAGRWLVPFTAIKRLISLAGV